MKSIEELQILWNKLGDIPVNNNDETEEAFLHFPKRKNARPRAGEFVIYYCY